MKKIFLLFFSFVLFLSACTSSEKSFYFESNIKDEKKLTLSFSALPAKSDYSIYNADVESTNVCVTDNDENILFTDILRTPVNAQGIFPYNSDYDIQMEFLSCTIDDEDIYVGLIGIPTDEKDYYTSIYVCKDEMLTVIIDLWPHVETIDDITINENIITFYDLSWKETVSHRIDFERFISKRL